MSVFTTFGTFTVKRFAAAETVLAEFTVMIVRWPDCASGRRCTQLLFPILLFIQLSEIFDGMQLNRNAWHTFALPSEAQQSGTRLYYVD
jgi:peptidoglycan biosynthesis protein MviN/MurJ (putative lipid II flippase)